MKFTGKEIQRAHLYFFVLGVITFLSNLVSVVMIPGRVALIIGSAWLILTCLIYFIASKNKSRTILYSLFNAVVAGIAMSSYYTIKGVVVYNFIVTLCIWTIVMIINYKSIALIKFKGRGEKILIVLQIVVLIISIVVWVTSNATLGSILTFISILVLGIGISYSLTEDTGNEIKVIGLSSLLIFVGIFVCVIVVLSEGEVLDLSIGDFKKKKKA